MRIEINGRGGFGGGATLDDFHDTMTQLNNSIEDVIADFKAVKTATNSLNGGVGNLSAAMASVDARIASEKERIYYVSRVNDKYSSLINTVASIDNRVAVMVAQNRKEVYLLYPQSMTADAPWYEQVIEFVGESLDSAWDFLTDHKNEIISFALGGPVGLIINSYLRTEEGQKWWDEHWYDVVNIGVTAIVAVGSARVLILFPGVGVVLVSAVGGGILAATRATTTQIRDKGKIVDGWQILDETIKGVLACAVTGYIGGYIGNAATGIFGETPVVVRYLGKGMAEVGSGIATRGLAAAIETFDTEKGVNWKAVRNQALDPASMMMDFAIGEATEAIPVDKYANKFRNAVLGDAATPPAKVLDVYSKKMDPDVAPLKPGTKGIVDLEYNNNVRKHLYDNNLVKGSYFNGMDSRAVNEIGDTIVALKNRVLGLEIGYVTTQGAMKNRITSDITDYVKTVANVTDDVAKQYADDVIKYRTDIADDSLASVVVFNTDMAGNDQNRRKMLDWLGSKYNNSIVVNDVLASNYDEGIRYLNDMVAIGASPEGCNDFSSLMAHEMTHLIDNMVGASSNKAIITELINLDATGKTGKVISSYAATSGFDDKIAEAVSKVWKKGTWDDVANGILSDDPCDTITKLVLDLLDPNQPTLTRILR